ncbi:MAG: DNA metabolism protein [Clostridia bacterium]|nr:DNA metabolism protein [Clostridia bacterium]
MYQWKFIDTAYIYDGSFNGLLTIVFDSYLSKTIPSRIVYSEFEVDLFCNYVTLKTDEEKANRIYQGIIKNISYDCLLTTYYVYLSNSANKELDIVQYLLLGFQIGNKIDHLLSNNLVLKMQKIRKRVFGEYHRLCGLVRFMKLSNGMFYSKIHPDNNVLEQLGHHFISRIPNENFILHDKKRNFALLYNTKEYIITEAKSLSITSLSEEEMYYQNLWRHFYHSIGIKERKNSKLRMQFMPKKYWQDLIEHVENPLDTLGYL